MIRDLRSWTAGLSVRASMIRGKAEEKRGISCIWLAMIGQSWIRTVVSDLTADTMLVWGRARRTGRPGHWRTDSFWRVKSMERGISCWIVSELTHAVPVTHKLCVIIDDSSWMTHLKRPSFHFWFAFYDLLHNNLPPFLNVSSIHTENGLSRVKFLEFSAKNFCQKFFPNFFSNLCETFWTRPETFFTNWFHIILNKFFARWNWFVACITLKALGTPPFFKSRNHLNRP